MLPDTVTYHSPPWSEFALQISHKLQPYFRTSTSADILTSGNRSNNLLLHPFRQNPIPLAMLHRHQSQLHSRELYSHR